MRIKPPFFVQLIVIVLILTSLITLGACSNATFSQLSEEGEGVFFNKCTICHGIEGIGGFAPRLDERLGHSFQNAKQIYDKIRFEMPRNQPGSPATIEYRQVLSYILLREGFTGQQEIFKVGTLSDIAIPKPLS